MATVVMVVKATTMTVMMTSLRWFPHHAALALELALALALALTLAQELELTLELALASVLTPSTLSPPLHSNHFHSNNDHHLDHRQPPPTNGKAHCAIW